jgi:lipoate-protein ligase A
MLFAAQQPTLRLYRWERPWITFGYFQRQAQIASTFPSHPLTRRWTGGGAVQHGEPQECTYALALPAMDPRASLRPRELYVQLHRCLQKALSDAGVEARLIETPEAAPHLACFQRPVPGDVVTPDGRKLAGAAQRRTRQGVLIQGSVRLIEKSPLPESFPAAFQNRLSSGIETADPGFLSPEAIAQQAAEKYGSDRWLRRVK